MAELHELQAQTAADSRRWFPAMHESAGRLLVHCALGVAGEVGEVVNLVKKYNRGDFPSLVAVENELAEELADVVIYAMLMASALGVDLAEEISRKREINAERFG